MNTHEGVVAPFAASVYRNR